MGSIGSVKSSAKENLYKGLYVEGTPTNQANADEVLKGVRDVLADFGMENELTSVRFNNKGSVTRGEAGAAMNGLGGLTINNKDLANGLQDSHGYNVSDTFYGTGAHEAGHAIVNGLLKSPNVIINGGNPIANPNLERATARSKGKLEIEILKEAQRRYGSNPKISGYGSTKFVEKVAEAVSDVYANGSKANPYSKVIVEVMKDIKSGKFRPKIKVTKREMGI